MARTDPQINVRIPADLLDVLRSKAKENGRSFTAEVVLRLRDSLSVGTSAREFREQIEKLEADIYRTYGRPESDD